MVAEILADAPELVHDRDANRTQQRCRPHPGNLQQLCGVRGAAAQDYLATRAHDVLGSIAIMHIAHANRTLALEQHRCGPRAGAYIQTSGRFRRMQEHARRRMPPAAMDRALEITDPSLVVAAVVIGAARNTHTDRAGHERLADRM